MEIGRLIIKTILDKEDFEDGLDDLEKDSKLKAVLNKITSKFSSIFSKVGQGAGKIGRTITQIGSLLIKTLGKAVTSAVGLGLAFGTAFAVITAIALILTAVAGAVKKVFDENQQLKTDIQYIIFAIKTALQPAIDIIANVLVKIIKFVITIFQYVMAIINLIAGRNVFKDASVDAFKKSMQEANKNSKATAKNAKEIKKQLAGFDEMNILGQNTTASGGAGGIGAEAPDLTPSFDATKLGDIEKKIKEFIKKIKNMLGEDIMSGLTKQWEGLGDVITGVGHIIQGITSGDIKLFGQGFGEVLRGIGKGFTGLLQTVQSVFAGIFNLGVQAGQKLRTRFIEYINEIWNKITGTVDKIKTRIKDNFKDGFWKGIINTLIDLINLAIGRINKKLTITIGDGMASFLNALGIKIKAGSHSIFKIPTITRLAKGGIVNMPTRGVPVGGAIAGEKGAEGVIPLTDSQQMALLGEAIGRYITINATVPVYVGNRQVAREIRRIEAEDAFAGNR